MSDVVFVQMPFAGIERPSLALGLFSAALRAAGLSTESIYANLRWAETIGLPAYVLVRASAPGALLGEWLFAESAFGAAARADDDSRSAQGHFDAPDEFIELVVRHRGHADLASLLAELRRKAGAFVEDLCRDILGLNPKVVACTSMFDQHVASLALLQRLKALRPELLTVIGGANCAGPMGRATHQAFPAVDFTVTGEFDPFVVEFFNALVAAAGDPARVDTLPPNVLGPRDRREEQAGAPLPPTALLVDMDSAVIPDYTDYFEQLYASPLGTYVLASLPLETSRGCWWGARQHCTFCGLNAEGMAFRVKSPERALQEIRLLTSTYDVSRCAAADNIIDMSYFQTVLPALADDERRYNLFYETKANLKRDHVRALAEAGCNYIQPGIESLHDETLALMKKGTTACQNIQLLKYCLEYGVLPAWSILCGFPGSDPQWVAEIAADLPLLFHLPPPHGTHPIRFDRFSPYHQRPEQYGLELEPLPAYRRVYPLDDGVIRDLAYFFRQAGGMPEAVAGPARTAAQMTARWEREFGERSRPQLVILSDDGECVRIRDTRSCAPAAEQTLDGRLATLFRALESPASSTALLTRLRRDGGTPPDETALSADLSELRARRLIWSASTQHVALPTPPPKRPLPHYADTAVGKVDMAKYLLETRRFRQVFA